MTQKAETTVPSDVFDVTEYVDKAMRTDAPSTAELIHRLTNPQVIRLLHASLGMVTEAGELADMLKKHIFANKPLDLVNAKEELGDNLWYVALAIDVIQTTMREVMQMNIEKLQVRFPDRFSEQHSLGRDVAAEREYLEEAHEKHDPYKVTEQKAGVSQRGADWFKFANEVFEHIENYTVPQYGDKGEDRATHYSTQVISDHIDRYRARMGTNARGQIEAKRDMIKVAHYASLEWEKLNNGQPQNR